MPKLFNEFIVLLLFLIACDSTPAKKTNKEENKELRIEHRKKKIKEIAGLNSASIALDSAEYRFTYQYQELITLNNFFLLNKYNIVDIEKKDSTDL